LLRVEFGGAICHVTLRANAPRDIFPADKERQRFVDRSVENGAGIGHQVISLPDKAKVAKSKRLHSVLRKIEAALSERRKSAMFYGKG
jgi:hypothetical protein